MQRPETTSRHQTAKCKPVHCRVFEHLKIIIYMHLYVLAHFFPNKELGDIKDWQTFITKTVIELESWSRERSKNKYAENKAKIDTSTQPQICPEYPGSHIKKGNGMNYKFLVSNRRDFYFSGETISRHYILYKGRKPGKKFDIKIRSILYVAVSYINSHWSVMALVSL